MTERLKDEFLTLVSGLVTPDIVVASTSVAELLGGESIVGSDGGSIEGRLNIPEYQRPYRWQIKHLQRLLKDLTEYFAPPAGSTPPKHDFYLGSVIVHQTREPGRRKDQLNIIDGQQRLISLALLAHLLGDRVLANGLLLASPESQMRAQQNLNWLKHISFISTPIPSVEYPDSARNAKQRYVPQRHDRLQAFLLRQFLQENARPLWGSTIE